MDQTKTKHEYSEAFRLQADVVNNLSLLLLGDPAKVDRSTAELSLHASLSRLTNLADATLVLHSGEPPKVWTWQGTIDVDGKSLPATVAMSFLGSGRGALSACVDLDYPPENDADAARMELMAIEAAMAALLIETGRAGP